MNSHIFNASLAIGWLLIVIGVSGLHSVWAGLLTGGLMLVAVTLLLALRVGVKAVQPKDPHHVSQ